MDQFASGQIPACPYKVSVGFSRWVFGLAVYFLLIILLFTLVPRDFDVLVWQIFMFFFSAFFTFFLSFTQETLPNYYYYTNLIMTLFSIFFLIISLNLLSLIPYTFAYTSHIIFTLTLASLLINFINSIGIERKGFEFIKIFLPAGSPLFLLFFIILIEFISYNTRVLSLAIRLFANIMSGHILLTIFAGFSVVMGFFQALTIDFVMNAIYILELVIAFLQGYVFLTLSNIYFHENIYSH
jgi:ATP synthase subunit 6